MARNEAAQLIDGGLKRHSLLEATLAKLELDTATEFIDKS